MNDLIATAASDQRNELSRSLRPRHVSMITIGGIIGAGLFVGSSVAIAAAGPAVILSYVLTGFLILLVMRMLGEMAVEMPQVRSFTEFTRAALGNWAGFSVGWLYWYFWAIVIPVEAIAGAGIIQRWVHLPSWEIGTVLMIAMTGVNLMSARAYGEFATGGRVLGLREETLRELMAPARPPRRGFRDACLKVEIPFSLGFAKPGPRNPFGHPSSFGAPGSGGSFAFADPNAQLGYAYFPNRMGTSLEDPRDMVLRAAVYRCLGERAPDGIRPTPRGEARTPLTA